MHSHENLIFTFVLLLTFKMVPCGHFCIFLTGLLAGKWPRAQKPRVRHRAHLGLQQLRIESAAGQTVVLELAEVDLTSRDDVRVPDDVSKPPD